MRLIVSGIFIGLVILVFSSGCIGLNNEPIEGTIDIDDLSTQIIIEFYKDEGFCFFNGTFNGTVIHKPFEDEKYFIYEDTCGSFQRFKSQNNSEIFIPLGMCGGGIYLDALSSIRLTVELQNRTFSRTMDIYKYKQRDGSIFVVQRKWDGEQCSGAGL